MLRAITVAACLILGPVVLRLDHALSRLLHIFFSNFDSDYRSEQPFRSPQPLSADVANNNEILQLDLAALYKLEPSWIARYVGSLAGHLHFEQLEECHPYLCETEPLQMRFHSNLETI